ATFGSVSSGGGSIGPLLSWTFPNRSFAHARIAEAGAAAQAAAAQFDGTVLTALQETETALDAYVREIEHNWELKQARDSAARASDQARTLFRFGPTGVLGGLNADATLAAAEAGARCLRRRDRRCPGQRIPGTGWWVGTVSVPRLRMPSLSMNLGRGSRWLYPCKLRASCTVSLLFSATMEKTRKMSRSRSRNPIYVALVCAIVGQAMLLGS